MIFQIYGAILIIGMFTATIISSQNQFTMARHVHAGVLALHAKFDAIYFNQKQALIIDNNHHPHLLTTVGPCIMRFTKTGNASKATTCQKSRKLTLRPGEGGIGYHW